MPEAIEMQAKRFGYFPRMFLWHGQSYSVLDVARCWTDSVRGHVRRHYFRVRCAEGDFDLFQDIQDNTWHVERFEQIA